MSAFMHNPEAFDEVAKSITRNLYTHDYNKNHFAKKSASTIENEMRESLELRVTTEVYGKNLTEEDKQEWYIERFCEALHKANQESVKALYHGRSKELFGDVLEDAYKCSIPNAKGKTLSLVELVKRLHSIEYQSNNVSNWDELPAAKTLHAIVALLEHVIVTSLPEYDEAKTW